jgi:hypothetical protein
MTGGYREQRNVSCSLDGLGNFPLVLCAVPGNPPGDNLSPLADEGAKRARVFVVNADLLIGTEAANFSALKCSLLPWPISP